MQIMIDIPEELKQKIDDGFTNQVIISKLWDATKNGIPLPKGHGRLLDEKDILDIEKNEGVMYDLVDMPDYIADVHAIIEADKAESEG